MLSRLCPLVVARVLSSHTHVLDFQLFVSPEFLLDVLEAFLLAISFVLDSLAPRSHGTLTSYRPSLLFTMFCFSSQTLMFSNSFTRCIVASRSPQ